MGLHTYTFTINGKQVAIKAKKEEAEAIANQLLRPVKIRRYFKELRGIIGETEEYGPVLYSVFGPDYPIADEEGYKAAIEGYVKSLPDFQPLTVEGAAPFMAQARDIFQKYIPVVDKRETKEQVLVRQAEVMAIERQRELEDAAWRAKWCLPDPVAIPEGMMAVYLKITFDDSDIMVDYFSPHMPIGESMLLAIVPKQRETQALARKVLARYPELNRLSWGWHTENYSMGHGNYLQSEYWGTEKHNAYDGRTEVSVCYEIQMNSYSRSMYAYKDYPGLGTDTKNELPPAGEVTIRKNEEKNGIEVAFPQKPEANVIEALKTLGFRWSRFQGLWWARYSDELMAKIQDLLQKPTEEEA